MKVSLIGSGNVATHLGKALIAKQIKIGKIWSRNFDNAKYLASKLNSYAVENLSEIENKEDGIIIIAVKDEAIAQISKELRGINGTVVHVSGVTNINVLSDFKKYGVFYPLQTFSKDKTITFEKVPICLEANNADTLAILTKLAEKLSNQVVEIDSEKRRILHLAAVFACNFPNYLFGIAQELLAHNQLNFNLIRPLIEETANKVQTALPKAVQTGPAIRNDKKTMKAHEALLENKQQLLSIYQLLSKNIQEQTN